jgi:hypothetical protein
LGVLRPLEHKVEGEERFLYGYNVDEVELEELNEEHYEPTDDKLSSIATSNPAIRAPAMIGLEHMVCGAVYYRPNTSDPLSLAQGARKRLIHDRPKLDRKLMARLKVYTRKWCEKRLRPLTVDDVPSFEDWVDHINQPESVKQEYREALAEFLDGRRPLSVLNKKKGFAKKEFYDEPKYHRIISSPDNLEKVLQGPLAHAMEEQLFKLPEFIKKIPRSEWPAYIANICEGEGLSSYNSDYSSFEASFIRDVKLALELEFALFMLSNFLNETGTKDILTRTRLIKIVSKLFLAWMLAKRHSGEMTTSLFNGFSNIVVNSFVAEEINGATIFKGVVEGDDGLFVHNGKQPTPDDFLPLGFKIKIIPVVKYYEASFCGVVFHPESRRTLANPWKALMTSTWASDDYLRSTLETRKKLGIVKGLSYLAQYPGCPVISALSQWMLRVNGFEREKLEDVLCWYESQRATGWWDRVLIRDIRGSLLQSSEPCYQDRVLIEKLYGMNVETQLDLESRFEHSSGDVWISDVVPEQYRKHWQGFVRCRRQRDPELHIPYLLPPVRKVVSTVDHPLSDDLRQRFTSPDIKLRWLIPA